MNVTALVHLHDYLRGYVHRDLRPCNILLFAVPSIIDGVVSYSNLHAKISDLGLGRMSGKDMTPLSYVVCQFAPSLQRNLLYL
jgi:serine/threonine protein kinase